MDTFPSKSFSRLGFHYYPDTVHFRNQDLEIWLPELKRLGAGYLTLFAPLERAIPEYFINGLLDAAVQPVLHFLLSTTTPIKVGPIRLLLRSYARWGVKWVCFYDRPNCQSNWAAADWTQAELVERFVDLFIPIADCAVEEGLTPIFPPLEPGGDYWDLDFLRCTLQSLSRRRRYNLLEKMALGAYGWTGQKSIQWGAGGPRRWPKARPYHTPEGQEDQIGFRIFDWYLDISERELGQSIPVMLLRAGSRLLDHIDPNTGEPDLLAHARFNLEAARLFQPQIPNREDEDLAPIKVLACNFWLLTAQDRSVFVDDSWYRPSGEILPVVTEFYRLAASGELKPKSTAGKALSPGGNEILSEQIPTRAISHYVLLPLYPWGAADWDLAMLQPLLQEEHPIVGFSLTEARLAARVTIVGGEGAVPPETVEMLRSSGCEVQRISDDGTLIASF